MRKFLIVSHGEFAGGIKSALELIMGAAPDVIVLQAYVDENMPVEDEIAGLLSETGEGEGWIVFTDLLGGSITNQVLRATAELGMTGSVHIVAGMTRATASAGVAFDAATPAGEGHSAP